MGLVTRPAWREIEGQLYGQGAVEVRWGGRGWRLANGVLYGENAAELGTTWNLLYAADI